MSEPLLRKPWRRRCRPCQYRRRLKKRRQRVYVKKQYKVNTKEEHI
jgi:hypothetical protein